MPEIGTSGSMSGDGKRSVAEWLKLPRPSSTLPPIELLRCELSAVGYREIATHQLAGDGGYLAVFSPPDEASRKSPRDIVACGDRAGTR
jgi:hypothetical protein